MPTQFSSLCFNCIIPQDVEPQPASHRYLEVGIYLPKISYTKNKNQKKKSKTFNNDLNDAVSSENTVCIGI